MVKIATKSAIQCKCRNVFTPVKTGIPPKTPQSKGSKMNNRFSRRAYHIRQVMAWGYRGLGVAI